MQILPLSLRSESSDAAIAKAKSAIETVWSIATGSAIPETLNLNYKAKLNRWDWPANRVYLKIYPSMSCLLTPCRASAFSGHQPRDLLRALMVSGRPKTRSPTAQAVAGLFFSGSPPLLGPEPSRHTQCHASCVWSVDPGLPMVYLEAAVMFSFDASLSTARLSFNTDPIEPTSATLRAAANARFKTNLVSNRLKALSFFRAHGAGELAMKIEASLNRRSKAALADDNLTAGT